MIGVNRGLLALLSESRQHIDENLVAFPLYPTRVITRIPTP